MKAWLVHVGFWLALALYSVRVQASQSTAINTCVDWFLGFSGDSCTETCAKESRTCTAEKISEIVDHDKFSAMVPLAIQLGMENRLPIASEFCNGGINTWPFATAPAVTSYQFHDKHEETLLRRTEIHYNCYFPSQVVGDCDTKFLAPAAQRFCACLNSDCLSRKRLRGKIVSKL
jgi:hypothetical protein